MLILSNDHGARARKGLEAAEESSLWTQSFSCLFSNKSRPWYSSPRSTASFCHSLASDILHPASSLHGCHSVPGMRHGTVSAVFRCKDPQPGLCCVPWMLALERAQPTRGEVILLTSVATGLPGHHLDLRFLRILWPMIFNGRSYQSCWL
jgi:hypothetical protein